GADVVDRLDQASAEKMAPHAIANHLAKKRIVPLDHPIYQFLPRILFRRHCQNRTTQDLRLQRLAGVRVYLSGYALARGKEPGIGTECFTAEPVKETGKAEIVVLAPAFKGMMMTTSTLHPDAQEDLGAVGDGLMHRLSLHLPVPVDGRRILPLSGRCDDSV